MHVSMHACVRVHVCMYAYTHVCMHVHQRRYREGAGVPGVLPTTLTPTLALTHQRRYREGAGVPGVLPTTLTPTLALTHHRRTREGREGAGVPGVVVDLQKLTHLWTSMRTRRSHACMEHVVYACMHLSHGVRTLA